MARFTADQAGNYGGQGGGGFFNLQEDKEVARIRFLYNDINDVMGDSVHEIKYRRDDGKEGKKYVNCLREYNDPVDACPFCRNNRPVQAKIFIPIYNEDAGKTQTWERGKKFFSRISSLCSRYTSKGEPLVSHVFEVERQGAKGDTSTFYDIVEVDCDDTTLDDLPEAADLSSYLLDKSAEDMEVYLESGSFPPNDEEQQEERPIRRRSDSQNSGNRGSRRTPSGSRREVF